jgi:signal transduction histidine kinase
VVGFYTDCLCSHHVKHSSITIPKNVVFLTCFIDSLLIEIFISSLSFLFFDLKRKNFVFSVLMDSLLAFNQLVILFISIWITSFNCLRHVWLKRMFVSSANNTIEISSLQNWISFIYSRNNNGPNTDPCGTPPSLPPIVHHYI